MFATKHLVLMLWTCGVVLALPLDPNNKVDDEINQEENEIVLGVTRITNGFKREEIPQLMNKLHKIRLAVKEQAFRAFGQETFVQRATTVDKAKKIIDGIKFVLDETLAGLDEVRSRVDLIRKNGKNEQFLTEEEAIFLENVQQLLPDVLQFTAQQFNFVISTY